MPERLKTWFLRCIPRSYHDIFKKTLIPITEMEKLMGKKAFAEILGSLVEKPKGRPTLVPVSDRRPAITAMDAAQEFTEITEVWNPWSARMTAPVG